MQVPVASQVPNCPPAIEHVLPGVQPGWVEHVPPLHDPPGHVWHPTPAVPHWFGVFPGMHAPVPSQQPGQLPWHWTPTMHAPALHVPRLVPRIGPPHGIPCPTQVHAPPMADAHRPPLQPAAPQQICP